VALAVDHAQAQSGGALIPTVCRELNLPDYEVDTWLALFTGEDARADHRANAQKSPGLHLPEVSRNSLSKGADPVGSSPEELERRRQGRAQALGRVIRQAASRRNNWRDW